MLREIDTAEKERLAGTGRMDATASAARVRASRQVAGMNQGQLARILGITKSTVSGVENGASFPSREMMAFFMKEHRIDFNFLISGQFAQLPGDVQESLFPALSDAWTALARK